MINRRLEAALRWLKRAVSQPREELDRWQRATLFAYDLGRFGARQLKHDRAPQMASALAFRALFGLVPVLVVATILVRSLIGIDEFLKLLGELLEWVSLDQVKVVGPAGVGSQSLAQWLGGLVGEAAAINLTAIGWIGLVVVVYAAIGLLTTIENAFNTIYRAPHGRAWTRRVPVYWLLLTVSPLAVGLAAWLNGQFSMLQSSLTGGWLLELLSVIWSVLFGWALMLGVYMLMPNTRVRFRPAAAGALVAVLLIEGGKRVLGTALANTFSISHLYGSLGLIPLFMFWIYLMWLVVLFGLQVSATLQMLHGRRLEEIERRRESRGLIEPAAMISVMEEVAAKFASGGAATVEHVAESLGIDEEIVLEMMRSLEDAHLVHRIEGRDEDAYCLARPAEQISAAEVIELGFRLVDQSGVRLSSLWERLREAQRGQARERTLASLVLCHD